METFEKIAKVLSGTCSLQEKEELDAWRKEAVANEEEFSRFKKIWELAPPSSDFKPDVERAWHKVQTCIFNHEPEISAKKPQLSVSVFQQPWAIAAAVAFLMLGSGIFFISKPKSFSLSGAELAVKETGAHEKQELILDDGTRIWLNDNSRIFYPASFEGPTLEVKLEGEAFFEVAHLPEKPFVIQAGQGKVQVLGTSFNLDASKGVEVQVSSGRVKFSFAEQEEKNSLILTAGEAAVLEGKSIRKEKQDPNFLAWKTGEFVFEDASLDEVFTSLEKYYSIKLSAGSPELLNCRLFARFQQQPLEDVLKVVGLTLNLGYAYKPGDEQVTFYALNSKQNCSPSVQ